jgi:hypothetical protein
MRKAALLIGVAVLASSCASLPPQCGAIESERYPVQQSWLLKKVDADAVPLPSARAEVLKRYQPGDEIWSYQAPEGASMPYHVVASGNSGSQPARTASLYRGYVLLRGCEAVYVVPSAAY